MGKGKGSFDHWAARVAISQIVFEIKGELHEQVIREAMRLAGNKLPGRSHFSSRSVAKSLICGQGCMSLSKRAILPSWGLPK